MAEYDWVKHLPAAGKIIDIRDVHRDVLRQVLDPTTHAELSEMLRAVCKQWPDPDLLLWVAMNMTGNLDCCSFTVVGEGMVLHWFVLNSETQNTFHYINSVNVKRSGTKDEWEIRNCTVDEVEAKRYGMNRLVMEHPTAGLEDVAYHMLRLIVKIVSMMWSADGKGVSRGLIVAKQGHAVTKISFAPNYLRSRTEKTKVTTPAEHVKELGAARKLNFNKQVSINSGFVYAIVNPAYNGWCKIGSTLELDPRLQTCQTYDPLARYSYHGFRFTKADRVKIELGVHEALSSKRGSGEWFNISGDDAMQQIEDFALSEERE